MKVLLPLTMIAALATSTAFADCAVPDSKLNIPNGSKATKDEMITAMRAVKAYDASVKTYTDCVKTEQDAAIVAGGDKMTQEERDKVVSKFVEKQNEQIDKAQKVADKFNAELRAYKAKNPA